MKKSTIPIIAIFIFLIMSFAKGQVTKTLNLEDQSELREFEGKDVRVYLYLGDVLEGKLSFYSNDSIYLINKKTNTLIFDHETIDFIKESGFKLDSENLLPSDFIVIGDSLVMPKKWIYHLTMIYKIETEVKRVIPARKVNVYSSYLFTISNGVADVLSQQMVNSDLSDMKYYRETSTHWLFGDHRTDSKTYYPTEETEGLQINLGFSYNINERHGLLIDFTQMYETTVAGFEEFGSDESHWQGTVSQNTRDKYWNYGNFISIETRSRAFSLAYFYSMANQRFHLMFGPSYVPVSIQSSTNEDVSENLIGLYTGGSINIFHRKWWFVNAKCQFLWLPEVEIGPYTASSVYDGKTNTSTFEKVSVDFSILTVGFGFGLRF